MHRCHNSAKFQDSSSSHFVTGRSSQSSSSSIQVLTSSPSEDRGLSTVRTGCSSGGGPCCAHWQALPAQHIETGCQHQTSACSAIRADACEQCLLQAALDVPRQASAVHGDVKHGMAAIVCAKPALQDTAHPSTSLIWETTI